MGFLRIVFAGGFLLGIFSFGYVGAQQGSVDCAPDPKLFKQLGSLSEAQRDALMKPGGAYDNAIQKCLYAKEVNEARAKEIASLVQKANEVQNNSALSRTEKMGMLTGLANRANEIASNDSIMKQSVIAASNKAKQNLTIAVKKEINYLTNVIKNIYSTRGIETFNQEKRLAAWNAACQKIVLLNGKIPTVNSIELCKLK